MTTALITPHLLRWARDRAGLSPEGAAKGITTLDKWEAWETGDSRPSFKQALDLAKKLHVPFGYLFLSSPPTETIPLPDLRTVSDRPPGSYSVDFLDTLYDSLRKRQWYHEYQEEEGSKALPFVGCASPTRSAPEIAALVRETLGINADLRQSARDPDAFLRRLVGRAEGAGILVLRSGVVGSNTRRPLDPKEFQGFAISDPMAPLVFVNGRDWQAAQVFTLVHELAHLWIGASGISNLDYWRRSADQTHPIERLCDRVAAETLLPSEDVMRKWRGGDVDANLDAFRMSYKVSAFVVLRQAYENSRIDDDQYRDARERLRTQVKPRRDDKPSGGNADANLLSRNSSRFTWALLTATAEGRVSALDAARLLNISVRAMDNAYKRLMDKEGPGA